MWPEFSTVNDANLVKKIFYDSGNIEFFPGYRFSLAPPVILGTYCVALSRCSAFKRVQTQRTAGVEIDLNNINVQNISLYTC